MSVMSELDLKRQELIFELVSNRGWSEPEISIVFNVDADYIKEVISNETYSVRSNNVISDGYHL